MWRYWSNWMTLNTKIAILFLGMHWWQVLLMSTVEEYCGWLRWMNAAFGYSVLIDEDDCFKQFANVQLWSQLKGDALDRFPMGKNLITRISFQIRQRSSIWQKIWQFKNSHKAMMKGWHRKTKYLKITWKATSGEQLIENNLEKAVRRRLSAGPAY